MAKEDYYATLGIDRDADASEIKKSYRKLAMKYHPDKNPGDEAAEKKFKELNEANDVLSDDEKRAAYDRFGHAAFEQGGPGGPSSGGGFGGFSDIFDEMFGDAFTGGGRRSTRQSGRGSDLRYNMDVTLAQAYAGNKTKIRVPTSVQCGECNGTGSKGGVAPETCHTCHGQGKVRAQQGFFTIERTCPTCHGQGLVISEACGNCSGSGRVHQEKRCRLLFRQESRAGHEFACQVRGKPGSTARHPEIYTFLSRLHRTISSSGTVRTFTARFRCLLLLHLWAGI